MPSCRRPTRKRGRASPGCCSGARASRRAVFERRAGRRAAGAPSKPRRRVPGSPLAPVGVLGDRLRDVSKKVREGESADVVPRPNALPARTAPGASRRTAAPGVRWATRSGSCRASSATHSPTTRRSTRHPVGARASRGRTEGRTREQSRHTGTRVTGHAHAARTGTRAHHRATTGSHTVTPSHSHSARRSRALQKIVTTKHALSCHAHTRHTPRHMVNTWFFPRGKARSCTATQHSALSWYAKLIMPHHGSYQACI